MDKKEKFMPNEEYLKYRLTPKEKMKSLEKIIFKFINREFKSIDESMKMIYIQCLIDQLKYYMQDGYIEEIKLQRSGDKDSPYATRKKRAEEKKQELIRKFGLKDESEIFVLIMLMDLYIQSKNEYEISLIK